ncbi:MAG: NAD(P)-dependent oxidoreductase [Planctomycetes bacterium]|nr:NAD(P)-dependent oxidoreductase [Planctomycetota bacterium]
MSKRKVLLTGSGGRMGKYVVPPLKERWDLRTLDHKSVPWDPDALVCGLESIPKLTAAMRGCEAVIHLAATSDEAPFVEDLVPNNVIGLYNVFEAVRAAGVTRLVFASSCQAVLGAKREAPVRADEPHRPVTLYGATKALGEVMGRYYHQKHGLEFVAIRIGWFQPYDSPMLREKRGARRIWLSPKDAVNLLRCAVEKPGVGYAVVHGTSIAEAEVLGLKEARELLGYEPEDDIKTIPLQEPPPSSTDKP